MSAANHVSSRCRKDLAAIETMPASLRECVHEFGSAIVNAFVQSGIRDPGLIRHLVKVSWDGARSDCDRQKATESGSAAMKTLDWMLMQQGSPVTAATLIRVLYQSGVVLMPIEPGPVAIEASMREVTPEDGLITKAEKHRRRLRAALRATARRLWPHLEIPE